MQRLPFLWRALGVIANGLVVSVPLVIVDRSSGRLEAAVVPVAIVSALCWVDGGAIWHLDPPSLQRRAWSRPVFLLCAATAASVLLVSWLAVATGAPVQAAWTAVGVALGAIGTWARAAAIHRLGPFFVSEVQWAAGQPLVDTGPYRYCRHPGDWGLCLALAGSAVASGTLTAFAAWALTLLPLTIVRSTLETRFLASVVR